MIEGLEGAAAGSGGKFDRPALEQILAGLGSRVFLLNNVHEDGWAVFESRWALSYLRGPLTRGQIKTLMDPIRQEPAPGPARSAAEAAPPPPAAPAAGPASAPPTLPPDIAHYFIPVRERGSNRAPLTYHPMLLGAAEVRYGGGKSGECAQKLRLLWRITDDPVAVDWDSGTVVDVPVEDLERKPEPAARFAETPRAAARAKSFQTWQKDFAGWIYRNEKLDLYECASLALTSNPGEPERDFRIRLQQLARERRDAAVESLRQKYAPKIAALEERQRRAQQAVERESSQARQQKFDTVISIGTTLLSSFMGRKAVSLSTLGRAGTAARGVRRSMKESEDVGRAEETAEALAQKLLDLDAEFKAEVAAIEKSGDLQNEALGKVSLKPTKTNITIEFLSLVWAPYRLKPDDSAEAAW